VTALVNPVGAALVALEVGRLAVIQRYSSPGPPMGAGITLAPWPNRVRNGRWIASGRPRQLNITERGRPNAIHGFVRHTVFEQVDEGRSDEVTLETQIGPEPGWEYSVQLCVTYRIVDVGLEVSYRATNDGANIAPFAVGSHPYFTIGAENTNNLIITVPAAVVLDNDEMGIPVGRRPVVGDRDLRGGRRVGDLELGDCYTDLSVSNGRVTCTLATDDGHRLDVWADPAFGYWQLYAPADFPGREGIVRAIAIEPMTAPPDALNSGEGLRWLFPGEEWQVTWGVSVHAAPPAIGSHLPDPIDT